MCEYLKNNICTINKTVCPWVYWCDKLQIWRFNKYMPKNCKTKQQVKVKHEGKYQVIQCRKNYLYVEVDNITYKLLNPFDFVPEYVDLKKQKDGQYIIKK